MVQLARMEGKIDLVNERHETVKTDLTDVKLRLHGHGTRIQLLEARDYFLKGERKGLALSAKAIHWLTGGGVIGILALIARHFGA